MSDQGNRYIKIPGDDVFLHTFKFNVQPLNPPIPHPKTLYYSLDPERYNKPKLLSYQYQQTGSLLVNCDLGVPVDELNMRSRQYNGEYLTGDKKIYECDERINFQTPYEESQKILDEKDELILDENKFKGKFQEKEKEKTIKTEEEKISLVDMFINSESMKIERKEVIIDEKSLKQRIEKTFDDVKKLDMDMVHPKKPEVKVAKIFNIFPNLDYIGLDVVDIKEKRVNLNINEKYCIKTALDVDKQEMIQVFDYYPNMEQEINSGETRQPLEKLKLNEKYLFQHKENYIFAREQKNRFLMSLDEKKRAYYFYNLPLTFGLQRKKIAIQSRKNEEERWGEKKQKRKYVRALIRKQNKEELEKRKRIFKEIEHDLPTSLREDIENYIEEKIEDSQDEVASEEEDAEQEKKSNDSVKRNESLKRKRSEDLEDEDDEEYNQIKSGDDLSEEESSLEEEGDDGNDDEKSKTGSYIKKNKNVMKEKNKVSAKQKEKFTAKENKFSISNFQTKKKINEKKEESDGEEYYNEKGDKSPEMINETQSRHSASDSDTENSKSIPDNDKFDEKESNSASDSSGEMTYNPGAVSEIKAQPENKSEEVKEMAEEQKPKNDYLDEQDDDNSLFSGTDSDSSN